MKCFMFPDFEDNIYFHKEPQLFKQLLEEATSKKIQLSTLLLHAKGKYIELKAFIDRCVPSKILHFSYRYKIAWIIHGLSEFPKCKICGRLMIDETKLYLASGSAAHCCMKCAANDPVVRAKTAKTNFSRFGSISPLTCNAVKQKSKSTLMKKYGVQHISQVPDIQAKIKALCLKRYGVEHMSQLPEVKAKTRKTCLEKYGTVAPLQNQEVRKRVNKTNRKRYGTDWVMGSKHFREKSKEAYLAHYGTDNNMKSEVGRSEFKAAFKAAYGVENPLQVPSIFKKVCKKYVYKSQTFHSAPELALFIYLEDHYISFEYQPNVGLSFELNGKLHSYYPDFRVGNELWELKGSQFLDKEKTGKWVNPYNHTLDALQEARRQCALKNNVKILYEDEYTQYLKYVDQKYGKNYLRDFKSQKRKNGEDKDNDSKTA